MYKLKEMTVEQVREMYAVEDANVDPKIMAQIAKAVSSDLWRVFAWGGTPEGHKFWSDVTARLEQIAEAFPDMEDDDDDE